MGGELEACGLARVSESRVARVVSVLMGAIVGVGKRLCLSGPATDPVVSVRDE